MPSVARDSLILFNYILPCLQADSTGCKGCEGSADSGTQGAGVRMILSILNRSSHPEDIPAESGDGAETLSASVILAFARDVSRLKGT